MSQSTLLLQKRKEMIKVDNQLEEMKREYERRMRICYERQKEFEVKQKELDFQVSNLSFLDVHIDVKIWDTQEKKFNRFIQENDHKKQVAINKQKVCDLPVMSAARSAITHSKIYPQPTIPPNTSDWAGAKRRQDERAAKLSERTRGTQEIKRTTQGSPR